jgi:hypothetical protein
MCDNLQIDLILSEDEEPKIKVRKQLKDKTNPKKIKNRIKTIKKSSFGQVKNKIYEPKYIKWIHKENRKIFEFFLPKKVNYFLKKTFFKKYF